MTLPNENSSLATDTESPVMEEKKEPAAEESEDISELHNSEVQETDAVNLPEGGDLQGKGEVPQEEGEVPQEEGEVPQEEGEFPSEDSDDEAPEGIDLKASKAKAVEKRKHEEESQRTLVSEKKKKRKKIEERNVTQQRAKTKLTEKLVKLPDSVLSLVDDVIDSSAPPSEVGDQEQPELNIGLTNPNRITFDTDESGSDSEDEQQGLLSNIDVKNVEDVSKGGVPSNIRDFLKEHFYGGRFRREEYKQTPHNKKSRKKLLTR